MLFYSKFAILGIVDLVFGDEVLFLGPFHVVITFIVVIAVMLLSEGLVRRFTRSLG